MNNLHLIIHSPGTAVSGQTSDDELLHIIASFDFR